MGGSPVFPFHGKYLIWLIMCNTGNKNFCGCLQLLVARYHMAHRASAAANGRMQHGSSHYCHYSQQEATWCVVPVLPLMAGGYVVCCDIACASSNTGAMCYLVSCHEQWHWCDAPCGVWPRADTSGHRRSQAVAGQVSGCGSPKVSRYGAHGAAPSPTPTLA